MKTSLIIGGSGQVGWQLANILKAHGYKFTATRHEAPISNQLEALDIRSQIDVFRFIETLSPNVIYLPAAISNVDYCEQHPHESYKVNVIGANNVIEAAMRCGAKLVFYSTDYIFNGNDGPYLENDLPNPICEYGKQKLITEHAIATKLSNYIIIRTTVVYGQESQEKNFIARLIKTLKNNQGINVPIDQIGTPTYAPYLAKTTIKLVESESRGIYNVAGMDLISRYEFACEAAKAFNLNTKLIRAVKTSELHQRAIRPLNAGLRIDKITQMLNTKPWSCSKSLKAMASSYHLTT